MRLSTRKTLIATVLLSCVLVFVAEQVLAQNATIKGKGKYLSTVFIEDVATVGGGFMGDVVEEKTTLVVTDVIFTNSSSSAVATVQVFRQMGANAALMTHPIKVPTDGNFSYNFGTGLEFDVGSHPSLIVTGASVGFTLVGYLRKG